MLRAGLQREKGRQPSVESLYRLRKRLLKTDPRIETIDARICRAFELTGKAAERIARAGLNAYFTSPVGPLHLFSDTMSVLHRIHGTGARIFIVTAGNQRIQGAKLKRLRLAGSPLIERAYVTGAMGGKGKKLRFRAIVKRPADRKHTLIVGDRPDSEIRAANQLGMWTVRKLGGEFTRAPSRASVDRPNFTVRHLAELLRLPIQFGE